MRQYFGYNKPLICIRDMKASLIITTLLLLASSTFAQWSNTDLRSQTKKHALFGSGDYITGNYQGGDIGINFIYNNKYSVKLGFSISEKSSTHLSQDFLKSGQTLSTTELSPPNEHFESIHLLFGRVFNLDARNRFRITLQGGPGISAVQEPVFQSTLENHSSVLTDYELKYHKKSCASFVLNPKIEFPVVSVVGLSIGPMTIINQERTFWGASIGLMYGIVSCGTL